LENQPAAAEQPPRGNGEASREGREGREGRGRRRRGRGGRDRGERAAQNAPAGAEQNEASALPHAAGEQLQAAAETTHVAHLETPAIELRPIEDPVTMPSPYTVRAPRVEAISSAATEAQPEAAPVVAPVAAAAAYTSVASEERVVEFAPPPVLSAPPVAREPIVLPSDLNQVETDPEKLRIAASKVAPPPPPRPPRVRPPLPPISNEPLIQIETRK
jgi:ribonuclease E